MKKLSFDDAFRNLNRQLVSIEGITRGVISKFDDLVRETDLLKLEIIEHVLENKRMSQASQLGFAVMKQDKKKLIIGLASAIGGSLLQGVVTKDKSSALPAGISSFNGFLRGLGDSRWTVSLDKQFIIVPEDKVFAGRIWVTLESLQSTIKELRRKVLGGEKLGSLQSVIDELKQERSKLTYVFVPISAAPEDEAHLGHWHRATE